MMKPNTAIALAVLGTFGTACQEEYSLHSYDCSSSCYSGNPATENVGECRTGWPVCKDEIMVFCKGEVLPSEEWCDSLDNDCNGDVDDVFGLGDSCDGDDDDLCFSGTKVCDFDTESLDCQGDTATPELCDNDTSDDDCNPATTDASAFPDKGDVCSVGVGPCVQTGEMICKADGTGTECSVTTAAPQIETCNNIDDDCDGIIDNITDLALEEFLPSQGGHHK